MHKEIITTREAARILGYRSPTSINRLIRDGVLKVQNPAPRGSGGNPNRTRYLVFRESVEEYARNRSDRSLPRPGRPKTKAAINRKAKTSRWRSAITPFAEGFRERINVQLNANVVKLAGDVADGKALLVEDVIEQAVIQVLNGKH